MTTDTALLIFDPHQDVAWMRRILEIEAGSFTHLVLGGDYFDTKSGSGGTAAAMADYLHELTQAYGDALTLLWGNHDIQYLEGIRRAGCGEAMDYVIRASYTEIRRREIAEHLSPEVWAKGRLFAYIHGHLISHAGLAHAFWPKASSIEDSLAQLEIEAGDAMRLLGTEAHPLLMPGRARNGMQPVGGITWQDFNKEFEDSLPVPQIFGHTPDLYPDFKLRARQRGRSWCLDGAQTVYGKLSAQGALTVHLA
jgi:hypothetical protein